LADIDPPPKVDPHEERARRRKEILDSNPRFACLTCLLTFRTYHAFTEHMERLHV